MGQLQLYFSDFCLWVQNRSEAVVSSTSPRIENMMHHFQQKIKSMLPMSKLVINSPVHQLRSLGVLKSSRNNPFPLFLQHQSFLGLNLHGNIKTGKQLSSCMHVIPSTTIFQRQTHHRPFPPSPVPEEVGS